MMLTRLDGVKLPLPHGIAQVKQTKQASLPTVDASFINQTNTPRFQGLAYPGKTQVRFGADESETVFINGNMYPKEELKFLNNKFFTAEEEDAITAGEILSEFAKRASECDGKAGTHPYVLKDEMGRVIEQRPPYDSRYEQILDEDFGFQQSRTQTFIMRELVNRGLLKGTYFSPTKLSLTNKGKDFAQYWDTKPKTAAGTDKTDDGLEYLHPPIDLLRLMSKPEELLNAVEFPPDALRAIQDKLKIAKQKGDSEAGKAKQWLNAALSLPWSAETRDNVNIQKARDFFEDSFTGMDELKDRLLDEIAARITQGGNQGGIILLVGTPGTGKTAVTEILAKALGRKFERISMAGMSDANKLRGHDYTYLGAKHGMIADALMKAGTKNPVILVDEIDKTGKNSAQGDPQDTLLAVLDPQQNHKFTDGFLDFPFDLSKVLFVCTANYLDKIPAPLLNRVEPISFNAYLPEEKIVIAQKHLIPKQLKKFKIPEGKIAFDRQAIESMILHYTMEGGVRQLERKVQEIIRKANRFMLENPTVNNITVTPERVDQWLTHKISKRMVNPQNKQEGLVNGMYYSEIGGGVLPIQVVARPGSGRLTLTGSLGDVMKESATVALSYIKTNAEALGIQDENLEALKQGRMDIHIHYPDGATKKDGPSAGTSTFLALWSALSKTAVSEGVALTGEIDLLGNAGPIGGVLEKVSGAVAQGVKRIYLPMANKKDYDDLCNRSPIFKALVEPIEVRFVKTAKDLVADMTTNPPGAPDNNANPS